MLDPTDSILSFNSLYLVYTCDYNFKVWTGSRFLNPRPMIIVMTWLETKFVLLKTVNWTAYLHFNVFVLGITSRMSILEVIVCLIGLSCRFLSVRPPRRGNLFRRNVHTRYRRPRTRGAAEGPGWVFRQEQSDSPFRSSLRWWWCWMKKKWAHFDT